MSRSMQRRLSEGHINTVAVLQEQASALLQYAFPWFEKMVDERANRFYYIAQADGRRVREEQPIRDLGTVWDVSRMQRALKKSSSILNNAMLGTTRHYVQHHLQLSTGEESPKWKPLPGGDRPHIGHSAGLILALLATADLSDDPQQHQIIAEGLARDVLRLRDPVDGHFDIAFDRKPMGGHEFYPGETIHALARAFPRRVAELVVSHGAYMEMLREGRFVTEIFFCNWLAQSGDALHTAAMSLGETQLCEVMRSRMLELEGRLLSSTLLETVRDPSRWHEVSTVEVACATEALAHVAGTLSKPGPRTTAPEDSLWRDALVCLEAVQMLTRVLDAIRQAAPPGCEGGYGHTLTHKEQRIDVTGHVVSAMARLLEIDPDRFT